MRKLILVLSLLFTSSVNATYVYEANQSLIDLKTNYIATSYNLASGDDQVSTTFNLDFTFTFYGEDFTMAKMATNGCLHFWKSGSSGYCNDYTPDPLPEQKYTLYPFWTDLIRDNGSSVLARNFTDKSVFGWYNLREFNRANSDNSFEVILWKADDSFEFRYGGLDIINHDVLIGEQGDSDETYTYLYYDMCGKGTTNSSSCVNPTWNASSFNTLLENGGSLYGVGSGNALDCNNPLNDSTCAGYDAAYLTQQCGIDSLYSDSCPLYWAAYDDLQCSLDSQYAPFCPGYTSQDSVAYYTEDETDYGYEDDLYGYDEDSQYGYDDDGNAYTEDDLWYDEEFEEYLDPNDPCYEGACDNFTDADWYALDLEEFGQEQVDALYGTDLEFTEEGFLDFDQMETSEEEFFTAVDEQFDIYDAEQEAIWAAEEAAWAEEELLREQNYEEEFEEVYVEEYDNLTDYDLYANDELIEELIFQEAIEMAIIYREEATDEFLEFETLEELDEWFEEEMAEEYEEAMAEETWEEEYEEEFEETFEEEFEEFEEEVFAEEEFEEEFIEEIFEEEAVEEIFEEIQELKEEERLAEIEEAFEEEFEEISVVKEESKSGIRAEQLNVVANTIQTATNSVSGTTSGTSIYETGTAAGSGGTVSTASTGGMSTSSSPSISAQVQSAQIQTQTVLDTSSATSASTSMSMDAGSSVGNTTSVVGGDISVASVVDNSSSVSDNSSTTTESSTTETSTSESSDTSDTTVASVDTSSTTTETSMSQDMETTTVTVAEVQVQDMQGEIDTAVGGDMSSSEANTVVDKIIAQNIENQQEQQEQEQEETGEYADSTTLIAYMGYVPGFDAYRQVALPQADSWYQSRDIYANVKINDNTAAFYGLYGESLTGMNDLIKLQPNL